MAKETFNGEINKHTDWGGDESTNSIPLTGAQVQDFIKKSFDTKVGYLFYDEAQQRYLMFADEESYALWADEDTPAEDKAKLLLGNFKAPFPYKASIVLKNSVKPIKLGSVGNVLEFEVKILNEAGDVINESVTVSYSFTHGSVTKTATQQCMSGDTVKFNIDNYIDAGRNNISITVQGATTLASTSIGVFLNVVDLQFSCTSNLAKTYNFGLGPQDVIMNFDISGPGTKFVEWYVNGERLKNGSNNDDSRVDDTIAKNNTKVIALNETMPTGVYSIQARARTTVDGADFYSDTYYREFIVYNNDASDEVLIALGTVVASDIEIADIVKERRLYGLEQYIQSNIEFGVFYPKQDQLNFDLYIDNIMQSSITTEKDATSFIAVAPSVYGETIVKFECKDLGYDLEVPTNIIKSDLGIHEITDNLEFDFRALGRTNNSTEKDKFEYKNYKGIFTGFNWNETSGWTSENALHVNAGATFEVKYAPLGVNPTSTGKTIEIEFASTNVNDDNAPLLDLRNPIDGSGILITASEIMLVSKANSVISTSYKSDEFNRIGFVINKNSETDNACISFIYVNGKTTRAVKIGFDDTYTSNANLKFTGTDMAEVKIKSVRIYNKALRDDDMYNNFNLYQDTVNKMKEVYTRNDIYEEGSTNYDINKMMQRLPVMLITGPVDILENASDKNTSIECDIEYRDMQDPTRSFFWKKVTMTPQGTSSMSYPKKNLRPRIDKNGTLCYDYLNMELALAGDPSAVPQNPASDCKKNKYSFKAASNEVGNVHKEAIPVHRWTLKADYAESSSTHNTGIARLWNTVLVNSRIVTNNKDNPWPSSIPVPEDEYVFKTTAQKCAEENDYPYDVRTTVDGFPILAFYRKTTADDWIFIGKYNFNNDKSTENVFGFTDIPGFDNSKMQCWEVLNNGNAIANFTNVSDFSSVVDKETGKKGWELAFEARYPDLGSGIETERPDLLNDLRQFCFWMNRVTAKEFITQKWEHFDIWKLAAYYVYLMRFGAVDQPVKNAMFTSEDGLHYYYINYDNDTINGLVNTGTIEMPWDADRKTLKDVENGETYYAGQTSRLWNLLEGDEEFMKIVSLVDNALYEGGLSYEKCIDMFDVQQSQKFVERVYNQDSQYKYVGPAAEGVANNLAMLQGDRSIHRKYWLGKRFNLYDAMFVSGAFKNNQIQFKLDIPETYTDSTEFTVNSGADTYFAWAVNNNIKESKIHLGYDESHTFTIVDKLKIGDPVNVYGAPNIKEFDVSSMGHLLNYLNVAGVRTDVLGTKLKKLIVGNKIKDNKIANFREIGGLEQATALEYLDVRNLKSFTSLPLRSQKNIKEVNASGSNIASIDFAEGAALEKLYISESMNTLTLKQLPYIKLENIISDNNFETLSNINVSKCPYVSEDFNFIKNWFDNIKDTNAQLSLAMDGIHWKNVTVDWLIELFERMCYISDADGNISVDKSKLSLSGVIELSNAGINADKVTKINDLFGSNVFNKQNSLFIKISGIFLLGKSEFNCVEKDIEYNVIYGGDESLSSMSWMFANKPMSNGTSNITDYGTLVIAPDGMSAKFTPNVFWNAANASNSTEISVSTLTSDMQSLISGFDIRINPIVLSTDLSINGASIVNDKQTYVYELSVGTKGSDTLQIDWVIDAALDKFASIVETQEGNKLKIIIDPDDEAKKDTNVDGYVEAHVRHLHNGIQYGPDTQIVSKKISFNNQTPVFERVHIGKTENDGIYATLYYSGLLTISGSGTMRDFSAVEENDAANSVVRWHTNAPWGRNNNNDYEDVVKSVQITSVAGRPIYNIGKYAFSDCNNITNVTLPESLQSIGDYAFYNNTSLTEVQLSDSIKSIGECAFYNCQSLATIGSMPSSLQSLGNSAFYRCSSLASSIVIPEGVLSIRSYTFESCSKIPNVSLPNSLTSIGSFAFQDCTSLKSISFSNKLSNIEIYAFNRCVSLNSLHMPESLKNISMHAFSNCSNLTAIELSPYTETLAQEAFNGCSKLSSVNIPDTVYRIESGCFSKCSSIKNVTIPNAVSVLENDTFEGCSNLGSITFKHMFAPVIKPNAFGSGSEFVGTSADEKYVHIPTGAQNYDDSVEAMKSLTDHGFIVSEEDSLKNEYNDLKSKILSSNHEPVSESNPVQYELNGVGELTIYGVHNNIVSFNKSGLNTKAVKNVLFANNDDVTSFASNAFADWSSLQQISLPSGLQTIGDSCFSNCVALHSITTPETLQTVGKHAFYRCSAMKTADMSKSGKLTTISDYMFNQCNALKTVEMPKGVNKIGQNAFAFCNDLVFNESSFGQSLNEIGQNAFWYCKANKLLDLSNTQVKVIPFQMCALCSSLEAVCLPNTTSYIYNGAFESCTKVKYFECFAVEPPTTEEGCFGTSVQNCIGYDYRGSSKAELYVPSECANKYSIAGEWADVMLNESFSDFTIKEVDDLTI